jgi:hypothetical protein
MSQAEIEDNNLKKNKTYQLYVKPAEKMPSFNRTDTHHVVVREHVSLILN